MSNILKRNCIFIVFFITLLGFNALLSKPWNDSYFGVRHLLVYIFATVSWAYITQKAIRKKNILFVVIYILLYLSWIMEESIYGVFEYKRGWFSVNFLLTASVLIQSWEILFLMEIFNKFINYIRLIIGAIKSTLFFIPLCIIIYSKTTDSMLTADGYTAIMQNNIQDIITFIIEFIPAFYISLFFIIAAAFLYVIFFSKKHVAFFDKPNIFTYVIILGLIIMATLATIRQVGNLALYATINDGMHYLRDVSKVAIKPKDIVAKNGNNGLYIVVIGESQTRDHMGVYGYKRRTTPWLSNLAADYNTILLRNVYSSHTHTVKALTQALTEDSQYISKRSESTISSIELLNAGGYRTTWLSNQNKFGVTSSPITRIGDLSKRSNWVNTSTIVGSEPDEILFEPFQYLLTEIDEREVIFIHLMGCHFPYQDRYNEKFEHFDFKYDNAILYNDFVVSKIFTAAQQTGKLTAFIYFSDHGEAPERSLGHDSSRFDYEMTRIPMYIWFSNDYINVNPQIFNQLKQREATFFSNDMFYDTLIGIIGIESPMYNPKQDLTSDSYMYNKDNLTTLSGTRKVADDPYLNNNGHNIN